MLSALFTGLYWRFSGVKKKINYLNQPLPQKVFFGGGAMIHVYKPRCKERNGTNVWPKSPKLKFLTH